MNVFEIFAAISIAIYAMIGGAFLNAAITAPANMRRLLSHMWQSVFELTFYGAAIFLVSLVVGFLMRSEYTHTFSNPFIWSGAAQLAVVGIFWGCRLIVDVLTEPGEPDD